MNKSDADRIERRIELKASPDRLWRALTDFQEFGTWFKVDLEGPFVAGQTTRGRLTYPGYEHMILEIAVQKVQPQRLFSYRWHPYAIDPKVDYSHEPPTLVEFKIKKTPAGSLLVVTESGFDGVPAARRDKAFEMHCDGWSEQMKNIEAYVARANKKGS
jgi:uncharacterized protein YndB with AHSA1/START domain